MSDNYTRKSTYTDGDVITAAHSNAEFDQLLAAFAASSGHTHDGSAGEGGPIAGLLSNSVTLGAGQDVDIVLTFNAQSTEDGLLTWKNTEDYFEFNDDILMATTEKLQFRDTAIYINSSTDGQLDLVADGAVLIDTAGDITLDADGGDIFFKDAGTTFGSATNSSGNLIIKSGTTTALTFSGANATFAGNVTIGSAEISEAELEILDGATVTTDELNLLDGGATVGTTAIADGDGLIINDAGTMRVATVQTLAAYLDDEITAMPNLVSVGTLTALTIDDVLVDGKVITLTGSSDDTATITASANGALDITTTDAAGAAGNIQITADGTAELAGTTVTLDSSGGITLDADGGTITFADAGSSLGTVTSSGFTGNVVGNVTGNVSGTAGSATGNAATATALATARNIGGTSFDGTGNIAVGLAATATALATARNIGGTSFDGTGDIAVALASVGTAVTVADESSDTTCFPLFTTAATGDLPPKSGTNLTFNASSGLLTATLLAGDLTGDLTGDVTGNADTATALATTRAIGGVNFNGTAAINLPGVNTAGNQNTSGTAAIATAVTVSDNESTNENNVILFGAGAAGSGNIGVEADGNMTYNPSTGKITATGFVGALTGAVTGNVAGNLTGTVVTATQNSITTATGLVTTGALDTGSITSGFGTINNGASTITTTGAVNFGAATVDSLDASEGDITNVGSIALDSISSDTGDALAIVFNQAVAPATHIDTSAGGSTAPDFSQYTNFVWTLTSNLVLTDPGDEVAGQSGVFVLIQDAGGTNTISTAAAQYFVPGATELVLSTAGDAVDVIPYMIQADGKILLGAVQLAFGDV